MSTVVRPYRNTLLVPEVIDTLAAGDPEGLLNEALHRRGRTLNAAMSAIAKHHAKRVISATPIVSTPAPAPKPAPKDRAKYPRLADGSTVSDAANALGKALYAAGKPQKYAPVRDFVLAAGPEFTTAEVIELGMAEFTS